MPWACKQHMERLYLDKDGPEEVFLDVGVLPQHQIDGIRFLYRQFKNKKLGVILSNPKGFGKTLQVALFLEAVRKLLDNPILILYKDESEVKKWMQHFRTRTHYKHDEIIVDSPHVYVIKTIFLLKETNLSPQYTRRDWSVVIVKNDVMLENLKNAQMFSTYRIWMTKIDLRKSKDTFNMIYNWLNSIKSFKIDDYLKTLPNSENPLNYMKMFNAFIDEIIIVRNVFQPVESEASQKSVITTPQISRKNKDVSGTKIKRLKVDTPTAASANATPKPNSAASRKNVNEKKIVENSSDAIICIDDDDDEVETVIQENTETASKGKMDVETFIHTHKPVEWKEYDEMHKDDNMEVEDEVLDFPEAVMDVLQLDNDLGVNDEKKCRDVDERSNNGDMMVFDLDKELSDGDTNLSDVTGDNTKTNIENYEINSFEGNKKDSDEDKSETKQQRKDTNKKNLDQKLLEMEERAIKKFKGSLLDRSF